MARIRSVKPDFFTSETILKLSHAARLTFIGLWTYADDTGRGRDDARIIKGALWSLEDLTTHVEVAQHLDELAAAGLICRYTAGGKRYLHITGWDEHQKVAKPSAPRHPECPNPSHHPQGPSGSTTGIMQEDSGSAPAPDLGKGSRSKEKDLGSEASGGGAPAGLPAGATAKATDNATATDPPPVHVTDDQRPTAQTLLAEYVDACRTRPTDRFVKQLGREIKQMIEQRVEPAELRQALNLLRRRGRAPSTLEALINEIRNPPQRGDRGGPEHVTPQPPRCKHGGSPHGCPKCNAAPAERRPVDWRALADSEQPEAPP